LFYKHRVRVQKRIRNQETRLFEVEKEQLKKEQALKKIEGYLEGQEKEKNRIAKELHDGIGGDLAGVHHLLYALNKDYNIIKLADISKNITSIANEVRLLSHHLSANPATHTPFEVSLANLKKSYETSKQFTVNISIFPEDCFSMATETQKQHLYRITQELLKNVSKHALAKEVQLSFTHHKKYLSFIFEDNGIGFIDSEKEEGIGLKNIKERLVSLHGKLQLDTAPGKGTIVSIEIPI
jgi:signal transduction histidine kinase